MAKFLVITRMRFGTAEAARRGLSFDAPIWGAPAAISAVAELRARVVSGQDLVNSC